MDRDGQALLLLVGVLLLALIGIATWVGGPARARSWPRAAGPRTASAGCAGSCAARRAAAPDPRRPAARARGCARGRPCRPAEFLLGVVRRGGALVLGLLLTLFMPRLDGAGRRLACAVELGARLGRARRAASAATCSWTSSRTSRGCWPTARRPGSRSPAAIQLAARELDDPAGTEMAAWSRSCASASRSTRRSRRLRERLPSRELGGADDDARDPAARRRRHGARAQRARRTLEARKDLMREIRTLLSGSVFTSYVVAGIGVATILLLNVISPGRDARDDDVAAGLPALVVAGTLWAVAFVLIRRATKVEVVTPLLAGALAALFVGVGLLGVPMLLDRGPVERLGGAVGGVATGAPLVAAAHRRRAGGAARAAGRAVDPAVAARGRSRAGSTSPGARAG